MHLYQLVVLLITAFMIYEGTHDFLRRKSGQSLLKYSVRLIVWGGMAAITAFPTLSTTLANIIGIEGNINAVILTGFLLIFLLIFKLLSTIEKLEQEISILTRKDALKEM